MYNSDHEKKINIVKYYTTVVHAILSRTYVIGSNSEDVNCINTYIVWKLLLQYELIDFTDARHVHITRIAKRKDIIILQNKIEGFITSIILKRSSILMNTHNPAKINLRTCRSCKLVFKKFQHSKMRNRHYNFFQLYKPTALVVQRLTCLL